MAIALAVLLMFAACCVFLVNWLYERDWREALAEADQLDPGWSFAELEAKRAEIPDEENSARRVLAAHAIFPDPWPPWEKMPEIDFTSFDKSLRELLPNAPLTEAQIAGLNGARAEPAPAL